MTQDRVEFLKREFSRTMEAVLDVAQLTTIPSQWTITRSKLLRLLNNFVRQLDNGTQEEEERPHSEDREES